MFYIYADFGEYDVYVKTTIKGKEKEKQIEFVFQEFHKKLCQRVFFPDYILFSEFEPFDIDLNWEENTDLKNLL